MSPESEAKDEANTAAEHYQVSMVLMDDALHPHLQLQGAPYELRLEATITLKQLELRGVSKKLLPFCRYETAADDNEQQCKQRTQLSADERKELKGFARLLQIKQTAIIDSILWLQHELSLQ